MQRLGVLAVMLFFLLIVGTFWPLHAGAKRYVDNGDLTVSDTLTGLIWQQYDNDTKYSWEKALSYCEGLDLAGKTNWRLPNYQELTSIIDDIHGGPALDPIFGGHPDSYWSGTTYALLTDKAWFVYFSDGPIDGANKSYNYYVRCVRGGPEVLGSLTLSKTGPGTGNVVSSPIGIDCGQDCTQEYAADTNVTLTATADAGSVFNGWSGGGCSGTSQCVVKVNGDLIIIAEFAKPSYSMSGAVKTGSGSPVTGVSIALSGVSSGTAKTDVGGRYSFSGLYNGPYTITPSKDQFKFDPDKRSVNVNGRNVVGQDFTATPPPLTADFAGMPLSGVAPLQVKFTDLSTGAPVSWYWTFGDGGTGAKQNPSHAYKIPGSYTVSLKATGPGGADIETKEAYITVTEPPPKADFSATPRLGPWPLTVQFTSSSTGAIASYAWDFGDGRVSSERNPTYTYTSVGVYTVKLTVTGSGGSDTATKPDYITVTEQTPKADFTADPTSGPKPLKVSFTNKSTGNIASYKWEFGDGIISYEQKPVYTYSASGTYTVTLTVTGPGGTGVKRRLDYIRVVEPGTLVADFTASPTSGPSPLEVKFSDQSKGSVTSWTWSFGDGGASTDRNPTHVYRKPGAYTVSLSVKGAAGSDVETKQGFITVDQPDGHRPDLIITAVSGPSSGGVEESIRLVETAKNKGDGLAGACKVGLYLSKDAAFSSSDILLGTIEQWELAAGATVSASANVTIPAKVQAGSYYLIAVADMGNKVTESNETNNARASVKRIAVTSRKPDLVVFEVSGPDTAKVGDTIEIYSKVSNQGTLESGPFTVELYFSKDAAIKVDDIYLRDYDLVGLKAGQNVGTKSKVTIPKDLAPGKYYIGAIADAGNTVNELNENNNGRASLKTIQITQ